MSFAPIGTPFIVLQQVESTNNYATGIIHAGMAQHGMAVFAHHQTKGKGQRNKEWYGDANKNVALSIIVKPQHKVLSGLFLLSMAVAVAVHRFITFYTTDEAKIKWPNDIYWRDRKTAGILIENIIQGEDWKWSVAGIGININQTTFDTVTIKAASLKQITGKEFEPVQMAIELCRYLDDAINELGNAEATIIEYYKRNLYKRGEAVLFKKENEVFTAFVKDVTSTGQLVVTHAVEEMFNVGEVEWVL